jgi:hypothetical protein
LRWLGDRIRRHRQALGGTGYRLNAGRQAVLALAWMQKNSTFAELADDFGVGLTTAWRYAHQVLCLLAPFAPALATVVRRTDANRFMIVDGTCIGIDRVADRRYWCGRHHRYEVNIQALISPDGDPVWTSPGLPGLTHDLTAVRTHGVLAALAEARVLTLGDKGYQGAGYPVRTPYKGKDLPVAYREANQGFNRLRAPGERGFAQLKGWKVLRRYRGCPTKVGDLVRAVLVLHQRENPR